MMLVVMMLANNRYMKMKERKMTRKMGLALTPVSWQWAMMKAEYHWVVPWS